VVQAMLAARGASDGLASGPAQCRARIPLWLESHPASARSVARFLCREPCGIGARILCWWPLSWRREKWWRGG